jgi:hypothetical protein
MRRFALPVLILAAAALGVGSAPLDKAERPVRVRLEWTSDKPEVWAGVLETSQGTIVSPASLGVGADQAGTLWPDGKSLWLGRRSPRLDDGFDATVIAPRSARLCFTLQNAVPGGWRQRFEWSLSDLHAKPQIFAFGDRAGHLSVRRAPGDVLRVAVDRPHLIYRPGEIFQAALVPELSSAAKPSDATTLDWEVCAPRGGTTLQQGTLPVSPSTVTQSADGTRRAGIPVEIPLPKNEGTFDIRFRLGERGATAQESVVQVLVFDPEAQTRKVLADRSPADSIPKTGDTLVDHFRTGGPDAHRRIESGPKIPPGKLNHLHRANLAAPGCAVEESAECAATVNWSAYRLEVKHPQRPHRLVVEMAAKGRPFVGVSVLEPNEAGRWTHFALESGVAVGPSFELGTNNPASDTSSVVRRQILFWPRVREPVLLLHDMGTGRRIEAVNVEVHELTSLADGCLPAPLPREERLVGPYMNQPTFVASFGAPQIFDRATRQSLDDWDTFHMAALRVADYLHFNGDNSLMLAVLAEGSTIYPSALLESTPRFDTGPFSSSGQDPIRKDIVELLYRVFDRERLVLIPELQLSSPLPALERQLAGSGPGSEGIELVGPDGRSWREAQGSVRGLAPYYNPLDPRVQHAVLDVVREFVERYRRHSSFRGIALEVDRTGYLQLPGLEWGCDDATVARFEHDTGVRIDGAPAEADGKDKYQRRHESLTGESRSRWIAWRCAELAKFYRRLADAVTSGMPDARLVLACKQVLCSNSETEIRREIRMRGRFGDLLPQRGLDFSLLESAPRLVVLRPAIWRTSLNPEDGLLDDAVNDNASFGSAFRGPESGVLAFHRPQEYRVCGIARAAPGHPTALRVAVHASSSGRESRRRFVRALASGDAQMIFDGGWIAPLGQDNETRAGRQIMRALPRIPFYKVECDDQPAIVRVARRERKTYIYAANEFAEPIQLTIQLTCPAGTTCRPLGPSRSAAIETADGAPSRLAVPLDGYGLAAWEIDHEDVRVQGFHAEMPASAIASLKSEIQRFGRLADVRRANQPKQDAPSGPTNPAGPVALAAASDKTDQDRTESPGHERPVAGAAYWTFDGNGSRVDQVDDVAVDAEPLSADDLRQLVKISLEISLAWEEQRFAECQRLLDSYWGRYLLMEAGKPQRKPSFREALVPPKRLSR